MIKFVLMDKDLLCMGWLAGQLEQVMKRILKYTNIPRYFILWIIILNGWKIIYGFLIFLLHTCFLFFIFISGVRIFEDVADSQVSTIISIFFFFLDKNYHISYQNCYFNSYCGSVSSAGKYILESAPNI
jgi:hypothetical protein